jgi:protein TonB
MQGLFSTVDEPLPRLAGSQPRAVVVSFAVHAVLVAALVLVPIFWSEAPPLIPDDPLQVFVYDPPPPPPLPPPLGSGLVDRARRAETRPPEPAPSAEAPRLEVAVLPAAEPAPTPDVADDAGGSPTGSPIGVPEGMEGGVEGGMVGGVPGGVIGGVIGGTGHGLPPPVLDYDQPPRVLRQPRPEYPPDAFVKKVEGVVVVEILIDDTGRVVRMRIVQSVPLLDAAALDAVRQWVFLPAIRRGRPVATVATAPVRFRIY